MVVAPDGSVSGSVSGGCVEGAVYELAAEVAQTGIPRLEHYGVSDDTAFAVGLTCGGIIDVFVEPYRGPRFPSWASWPTTSARNARSPSRPSSPIRTSGGWVADW